MATTTIKTLLAGAAFALLTACGSDAGTGSAPADAPADAAASPAAAEGPEAQTEAASGAAEVEVVNIAFKPQTLEVAVGDKVTWTSGDQGVKHTVTAGTPGEDGVPGVSDAQESAKTGEFDGPLDDAGATFSHTFSEAGSFAYFCEVHPSMTGEVVVR